MANQEQIKEMPESARDADTFHVARAMTRGGGFMTALAAALQRADSTNRAAIFMVWGESIQKEWEVYRRVGGW